MSNKDTSLAQDALLNSTDSLVPRNMLGWIQNTLKRRKLVSPPRYPEGIRGEVKALSSEQSPGKPL